MKLGSGGCCFFFQAEDGIRDVAVTGVQTCALPISAAELFSESRVSSFPLETRSHLFILQERVQIPRTLGKICGRAEATAPLPADAALRHNSRWLCFLASKPAFLRVRQFGEARVFLADSQTPGDPRAVE